MLAVFIYFILLSLIDLNGRYTMQCAMWKPWLQQIAWLCICKISSYREVILPLSIPALWQTHTSLPHYTQQPQTILPAVNVSRIIHLAADTSHNQHQDQDRVAQHISRPVNSRVNLF